GGQEPHDLELSPGDRVLLERADVVAYLGDIGFQPQIEQAVRSSGGQVVSAADVAGDRLLPVDGAEEGAGADPHLWFEPAIMADLAAAVGEAFAEADPPGAERYAANARALRDAFLRLDGELDALLERCEFDQVIVSHEAYAYLLEPHGLRQEGVSGAGGHVEASPQRVAELAARVRAERIPAVLVEPVEGRADAEAVAAEAGVELVELYSLDIVTDDQAAKGLLRLLLEQGQAVARVARCAGRPGVAS
ncbi:MAG: metal ABC transporter substrate-binding protein, partial [Actinomycetota bacterium]|nr:metal ABC transporter substrate-binding protein [Actinomycetota bacterium]